MMLTLREAQSLLPGARLVGDPATGFDRVHTDTRSLRAGDLFVALRGERFDAHDFLAGAGTAGAVAAVAEHGLATAGLAGLEVDDTLAALTGLADGWRRRFELPLIAVTGSNGKTTVTQMIASILRAWHGADAVFATAGNLNNHIGVPLMLLRLRAAHRAGVLELGMNHAGEIAGLAALARPTVALVNNAQREHQEFMASVDAVARENGAAIEALPREGCAVYPHDDPHASTWQALAAGRRTLTFGLKRSPTAGAGVVPASEPVWQDGRWLATLDTPAGTVDLRIAAAGRHNLRNALAATAAALAAGAPLAAIAAGLEAFQPVAGRSQIRRFERDGRSVTLVDDTYNANPDSVRAAIEVLAGLPGPRWLVLGDMGEVGDQGPAFHREVGAYARAQGIETLWTVGRASTHAAEAFGHARHFDDMGALLTALVDAPECASIVVKGSRFMQTERVVAALLHDAGPPTRERRPGDAHAA